MRESKVTRTITTTDVTVLCANQHTEVMCDVKFTLLGKFSDNEKLLKAVKEVNEDEGIYPIRIKEKTEKTAIYGMPEKQFFTMAVELPPRVVKEAAE